MQDDLSAQPGGTSIRILGVNAAGLESGNPTITAAPRDIPWLQDTVSVNAWTLWGGKKDTVMILDRQNVFVQVWDLAARPLGPSPNANYDALKALLKSVAGEP